MKKTILILIICILKLNAFEDFKVNDNSNTTSTSLGINIYWFIIDDNNQLKVKIEKLSGQILFADNRGTLNEMFFKIRQTLNDNAFNNKLGWISNDTFQSYYKNNLKLLNGFYQGNFLQSFLNYLYNPNNFINTWFEYENYEILYNEDGLAVESIVDGVWAGLYDDSQKSKSGAMYNKNGSMVYYNGKEVTPVTSFLVWLQKFTNKVVIETFEEIQRSLVSGIIAAVVLVLAIVRFVLELLPSSITPRRRRYYGGGRGSLPDYGDGSQVAASVRARLAAKNRALKARAYDRSCVEQSTVNGILFDLENDR